MSSAPENPPQEGEKKMTPSEKKAAEKAAKKAAQDEAKRQEDAAKLAKIAEAAAKYAHLYGKSTLVQSTTCDTLKITHFANFTPELIGQSVLVRARVQTSRKQGSKMCFLVLRETGASLQALIAASEEVPVEMVAFSASISCESIVDIRGTVTKPEKDVESTSLKTFELLVSHIHVISESQPVLPFQLADASRRAEAEPATPATGESGKKDEKAVIVVNQDTRLNCRWLDLRTPASNAIFKVQSRVCQYFREFLITQDFTEIHTPKIIGAASEGGANVFKVKYFDKDAFLAQSPQLYKQMCVQGDLPRVFEVGSVFRAENANTHRHLTEFIGMDIEMVINEHYYEVLNMAEDLFAYMFSRLAVLPELKAINEQHPFEPFIYNIADAKVDELGIGIVEERKEPTDPYQARIRNRATGVIRMPLPLAIRLLNENRPEKQIPENEDMDTESEKALGVVMKKRYGVDFYILDRFPASARPFYTMPCIDDPNFTNSYDLFMRGEEISSGAQRIHDPELLLEVARKKGVDMTPLKDYVDSFRLGAWPHGGFGVGMERVVMLYLGLKNVRYTSMFPRDPHRVTP